MDYFPLFVDLHDQPCLIVGGGEVAARKADMLLQAGALVTVVAPELGSTLRDAVEHGRVAHVPARFESPQLDGQRLVIAATNDSETNRAVAAEAEARGLLVNVVDDPDRCRFIVPSIVDRGSVVVAVSTGGASPVLARMLRSRLETLIPAAYGRLAALSAEFRNRVKARFAQPAEQRRFWERVLSGPVAEMVYAGNDGAARAALEQTLSAPDGEAPSMGEVYLVGGGPGDPDLLTFRALRLMQQADVVVYDRLVAKSVLDLTRRDAERVYVGKAKGNHAMRQEEINKLLARLAKQGHRVLRLKGGDPFIFGRGGEEIDTLASEGVPFQVVPGITAASGCAAYAGIPLTHRDFSQAAVFVTGHLQDGSINLNWDMLSQPNQTVVFYMGLTGIEIICEQMIAHGVSPDMPAALVQQGTTQNQQVYTGTLATLPSIVEARKPHAPTLIIVGEVVSLQHKLAWFNPHADEAQAQYSG